MFGEISTGASDDLEKASQIVRQMLTVYGMSKTLPNLSLVEGAQEGFLGQGPREHAAFGADRAGDRRRDDADPARQRYDEAKALLSAKRDQLEALATRLLAQEKMDEKDLLEVLGPRPA